MDMISSGVSAWKGTRGGLTFVPKCAVTDSWASSSRCEAAKASLLHLRRDI